MSEPEVGEGDAFADFVALEAQNLMRFSYLLTGRASDSEDLVQAVLERLLGRDIATLEDPSAYARRALVNEFRSTHRRALRAQRAFARIGVVSEEDAAPASKAFEDRAVILVALQRLKPRQRAAVLLRYFENLDDSEIAEVLGCARPTVRSLISRAMPVLREQLVSDFRTGNGGQS